MTWVCKKCSSCCEILPIYVWGHECEHLDKETKLCKIYKDRPDICKAKHPLGEAVTKQYCDLLRNIRRQNEIRREND